MFQGKSFHAATALCSLEEIAAIVSKATGQTAVQQFIPLGKYREAYRLQLTRRWKFSATVGS